MTSEEIERLRMDERLKVVRGLEDNTMKSACRRVNSDHLESNAIIGIIFETIHSLWTIGPFWMKAIILK